MKKERNGRTRETTLNSFEHPAGTATQQLNLNNDNSNYSPENFTVTQSVTFPCNFTFPDSYKEKTLEDHKLYVADFVQRMKDYHDEFNFGNEYTHSEEFIEKFGDWEKANRIEKLNCLFCFRTK